jgi:acyl-CoA thioester hydrolase
MTANDPRSTSSLRVRYAETDQMGVVYYANYFVWFEVGRTDLLRSLGGTYRDLEAGGIFLPVIEAACTYAQPSRYDDELEIRTDGRLLSPVRVEFTYEVVRRSDGVTTATGRTVHAAIDRTGRPCRLPAAVRDALSGGAPSRRATPPIAPAPTSEPARVQTHSEYPQHP